MAVLRRIVAKPSQVITDLRSLEIVRRHPSLTIFISFISIWSLGGFALVHLHDYFNSDFRDSYIASQIFTLEEQYTADMRTVQSILSKDELGPVNEEFWTSPELQNQLKSKLGDEEFRKFEKNIQRLRNHSDRLFEVTKQFEFSWSNRIYWVLDSTIIWFARVGQFVRLRVGSISDLKSPWLY
jgi:hypothetical protein